MPILWWLAGMAVLTGLTSVYLDRPKSRKKVSPRRKVPRVCGQCGGWCGKCFETDNLHVVERYKVPHSKQKKRKTKRDVGLKEESHG